MNNDDFKKITQLFESRLTETEERIIKDLSNFMENDLIPLIEENATKEDVERIERRIDHLATKIGEHDVRLKNIETTPTVAHELRSKKH